MESAMRDPNKLPSGRNGRGILAAFVAAGAILGAAASAEAGEGRGKKHRHYYYAPGYAPAPVYYAPRPVAVYPAPVMYAPAYPVYGPPGGSVNLDISLPLR